eukprot:TRINITY_DN1022_c0_g1_i4.p1 TRINITY_DN1022_c0_g1~~TRINITY_DN1022_c0_g1_i4.p1  ORF type:complete len:260 (-),score=78.62 TRINITY_DN1022_c0_g1_i4:767-1504(-)
MEVVRARSPLLFSLFTFLSKLQSPWSIPPLTFILGILSVDVNFDMCGLSPDCFSLSSSLSPSPSSSPSPSPSPPLPFSSLSFISFYYRRMTNRPIIFDFFVLVICGYLGCYLLCKIFLEFLELLSTKSTEREEKRERGREEKGERERSDKKGKIIGLVLNILTLMLLTALKLMIDWSIKPPERILSLLEKEIELNPSSPFNQMIRGKQNELGCNGSTLFLHFCVEHEIEDWRLEQNLVKKSTISS